MSKYVLIFTTISQKQRTFIKCIQTFVPICILLGVEFKTKPLFSTPLRLSTDIIII